MKLRVLVSLSLLAALGACGAEGSDDVFTKGNPKLNPGAAAVPANGRAAAPALAPRIVTRVYRGSYLRQGDYSRFQPCGTRVPLTIYGPIEARVALHERFRYGSVVQGRRMFGVLQGAIVIDTLDPAPDPGPGRIRTRFFITAVDTLRTWLPRDCGGRVP